MEAIIYFDGMKLCVNYSMLDIELGEIDIHSIEDSFGTDLYDSFEEKNDLDSITELVLEYDPYK